MCTGLPRVGRSAGLPVAGRRQVSFSCDRNEEGLVAMAGVRLPLEASEMRSLCTAGKQPSGRSDITE